MILKIFLIFIFTLFFISCSKDANTTRRNDTNFTIEDVNSTDKEDANFTIEEINTTRKEKKTTPLYPTDTDNDGLADKYEASLGLIVGEKDASSPFLDPLYTYQWHLNNSFKKYEDINIQPVWRETIGEKNITVAIVDTGVDANHSDLVVDFNKSFRYSDDSNNPSPTASQLYLDSDGSAHGTACAGIVAEKGWNEVGGRGIAPNIDLVGLNVFSSPTDAHFASALLRKGVDVSSNSWGGGNANSLYDDRTSLEAIESGVKTLRQGKGVVYVFASGNDSANANFQSILTSGDVIAVSAVDEKGKFEKYSDFGSDILLSAPGGASNVQSSPAIITTDLAGLKYGMDVYKEHWVVDGNEKGDYTHSMDGTSAACPMVSGVVGLMLSVNSNLTYKDVQYILAKTARKNDANDSSWSLNGAGISVSDKYGFGVVDATSAVHLAKDFVSLGKIETIEQNISVEKLPRSQEQELYSVNIEKNLLVKDVYLNIKTDHDNNGKLKIVLESPSGTQSTLAYGDTVLYDKYNPWKFLTTHFLDENASGEWKVSIEDTGFGNKITYLKLSLEIQGYKK